MHLQPEILRHHPITLRQNIHQSVVWIKPIVIIISWRTKRIEIIESLKKAQRVKANQDREASQNTEVRVLKAILLKARAVEAKVSRQGTKARANPQVVEARVSRREVEARQEVEANQEVGVNQEEVEANQEVKACQEAEVRQPEA